MKSTQQGLTILELLLALVVGSVTLHAGTSSYQQAVRSATLNSVASTVHSDLFMARSEAISRNTRVTVEAHDLGWEHGWSIYVDDNANARHDPGEELLRQQSVLPGNVTLSGNRPVRRYLSFVGSGLTRAKSGGMQFGTLMLCDETAEVSPATSRAIIISTSGRPRVSRSSRDLKNRVCSG